MKKGATSWCLKTKSNWVDYNSRPHSLQYLAIHKSFIDDVDNPNMDKSSWKSGVSTMGPERYGWTTRPIPANSPTKSFVGHDENNKPVNAQFLEKILGINIWEIDAEYRLKLGYEVWEDHVNNATPETVTKLIQNTTDDKKPNLILNILNGSTESNIDTLMTISLDYLESGRAEMYELNRSYSIFRQLYLKCYDYMIIDKLDTEIEKRNLFELFHLEEFNFSYYLDNLPKLKNIIQNNIEIDSLLWMTDYFEDFIIENIAKVSKHSMYEYILNWDTEFLKPKLVTAILQQEKFYDYLLDSGQLNFELLSKSYECIGGVKYEELLFSNKNINKLYDMVNYDASEYPICIKIQEIIVSNLRDPTDEMLIKLICRYINIKTFSLPKDCIKDKQVLLFLKSWRIFDKNIPNMTQSEVTSNFNDLKDIYQDLDSDILKHRDVKYALNYTLGWREDKDKTRVQYLDTSVFKY